MDCLRIRDEQTFFLNQRKKHTRPDHGEETNPKRPVPTCNCPVFFQNSLLYNTGLFTFPPPSVAYYKRCEATSPSVREM